MRLLCLVLLLLSLPSEVHAQQQPLPIIDMHLHAHSLNDYGGGMPVCTNAKKIVYPGWDPRDPIVFEQLKRCESPMPAAASDEALMRESLALLERHNIYAVTTGSLERVSKWRSAAPDRIIPAVPFSDYMLEPTVFRHLFSEGRLAVFAEISPQYQGLGLADESLEPYFALAEELDIPVGVHLGEGPVGGAHFLGGPTPSPYRARLTSPFQLEEVLIRHPRLRIYVMHFASPLVDEMIAMLFSHPQLYVDIACNNWNSPREHFYSQLKRLIDAGFEERIMWGSDQMVWPGTIEVAIETIEEATFLSTKQKRDIFYNNAARFLRFSEEEIAQHHER